jgi:heptosyltransferase-2
VLLGSKDEIPAAQFIEDAAIRSRPTARDRLINLTGKTSLADLNGIYPRLNLVITNDSSPIHYASAFNVPTVAIFGATVPAMGFGPLATGSKIAEVELPCRPCGAHGGATCPLGHFKCMNDLSVEAVLEQVAKAGSNEPK